MLAMFLGLIYVFIQVSGQRVELSVLQSQSSQLRELQKEVATQNASLSNLKTDLARVQDQAAQLTAMKVEIGELKAQYNVFDVEFTDQRDELSTLRSKVSLIEQNAATFQTAVNTGIRDEQRLHNHVDELTAANTQIQERLAAIETRLNTAPTVIQPTPAPTPATAPRR